jgi:hypothetical protein
MTIIGGLNNAQCIKGDGGDHEKGTGSQLTVAPLNSGAPHMPESIDQVIADQIGGKTKFPSLQLSCSGFDPAGTCNGVSCTYQTTLSWRQNNVFLAPDTDPARLFNKLFAGFDPTASATNAAQRQAQQKSVLDYVLGEAGALRGALGSSDQARLDQYLTSVRSLEQALAVTPPLTATCSPPAAPAASMSYPSLVRFMSDLIVLALQCDLTRVLTFMQARSASGVVYDFVGINHDFHLSSHFTSTEGGQSPQEKQTKSLPTIDKWNVQQVAYLAAKMDAINEGDGTLLDHTVFMTHGELGDSAAHDHSDLSIFMLGGGKYFKKQQFIAYPGTRFGDPHLPTTGTSAANLYSYFLQIFGAPSTQFADSTGVLTGIA